jgi:hypothetical protein
MALELVPVKPEHISELGRIAYKAFKDISDHHHFPSDFSSAAMGRMIIGMLTQSEEEYGVAAMMDGQLAGSNFLLVSDEVGGLGPITVVRSGTWYWPGADAGRHRPRPGERRRESRLMGLLQHDLDLSLRVAWIRHEASRCRDAARAGRATRRFDPPGHR